MHGMQNEKRVYDKGVEEGIGKEDFRAKYKIVEAR
jgi:hypothetical protein